MMTYHKNITKLGVQSAIILRKNLIANRFTVRFPKTKKNLMVMRLQTFIKKKCKRFLKGSYDTCLAATLIDFVLKNDENCYP